MGPIRHAAAILAVLLPNLTGCWAGVDPPTTATPGASASVLVTVGRPDGTTFDAVLFYPTAAEGVADYDPTGAPYPAVSFGHGFLIDVPFYESTLGRLAARGYFVIATRSALEPLPDHAAYARDLLRCLDYLEAENADETSPWFQQVDTAALGLFGHSMGGGAALAAAATDDRLGALVTLAPSELFDPSVIDAAPSVTAPSRFIVGDMDGFTPADSHALRMYESAPPPKQFTLILGGNHCGFMDRPVPFFCDLAGLPRDEQLDLTVELTADFFDNYLKQSPTTEPLVWGPAYFDDPRLDTTRAER
jgi:pimeloyl-ACP methyl ester carboxylesterase